MKHFHVLHLRTQNTKEMSPELQVGDKVKILISRTSSAGNRIEANEVGVITFIASKGHSKAIAVKTNSSWLIYYPNELEKL